MGWTPQRRAADQAAARVRVPAFLYRDVFDARARVAGEPRLTLTGGRRPRPRTWRTGRMPLEVAIHAARREPFNVYLAEGDTAGDLKMLLEKSVSGKAMGFVACHWAVFRAGTDGAKTGDKLDVHDKLTPAEGRSGVHVWVERVVGAFLACSRRVRAYWCGGAADSPAPLPPRPPCSTRSRHSPAASGSVFPGHCASPCRSWCRR